jgi:hypothetical protein
MSWRRTIAAFVAKSAMAVLPKAHREWGAAMVRELDDVADDWAALAWAAGSLEAALRARIAGTDRRRTMRGGINRVSSFALAALSSIALLPLALAYGRWALSGHMPVPEKDEGWGAHVFQLSIALMLPTGIAFLATGDWKHPARAIRPLAFPAVVLSVAFTALYFGEHYL